MGDGIVHSSNGTHFYVLILLFCSSNNAVYFKVTQSCLFFFFLQGLIFVVDSNDRERIQEAAEELQKMVIIKTYQTDYLCVKFTLLS